ncbi:MAG: GreA/GreB family elongation factor [Bacteroidales bacterium]|nr:GreA/GreB family elongation factor [Bacteroidales bacterium]
MSRGFVKEGDQEEVPMILPRAFLPSGVTNYVTPEGLRLLHDEMESLKEEWTAAGSNYVTKNYLDAKMRLLAERINTAVLVDATKANPDVVSFGMYVRYNDKTIRIVGVDEADASKGLISFISPIAKALIGKKKGDKFEIKVPRGTETIEIHEVATFLGIQEFGNSGNERQQDYKTTRQQAVVERNEKLTISTITAVTDSVAELIEVASDVHELTRIEHENVGVSCRDVTPVASNENSCKSSTANSQQPKFTSQDAPTDFLPLVNEQGNIVGRALHCQIHNGNKVLHPAVHLVVSNSNKEIVGKYCWHIAFGETAEKTLKRKISDITSGSIKPKFKKQYIREDKNEKELVYVFTAVSDAEFLPSPDDKEYEAMFAKD